MLAELCNVPWTSTVEVRELPKVPTVVLRSPVILLESVAYEKLQSYE
jgi:hypothetical protein